MPIRKPYYASHQIISGRYTPGNEYVLSDGVDYIGSYHALPNGQVFTGGIPKKDSEELFEKRIDISDTVLKYNSLKGVGISKYISPIPYQPSPNADDYSTGEIQRFFVQKRNNPLATIIEIDTNQFNSINIVNAPGINGDIWNKIMITWKISRFPVDDIAIINRRALINSENNFPGIGLYISNVLEFYR